MCFDDRRAALKILTASKTLLLRAVFLEQTNIIHTKTCFSEKKIVSVDENESIKQSVLTL